MFKMIIVVIVFMMAGSLWAASPTVGSAAPAWQLNDASGEPVVFTPASHNKPVVMLFWATWCPYCRALMPHLAALQNALPAGAVDFYALNVWEDGDAAAYLKQHKYHFTLIPEADAVAKAYGVAGTPGLFLIDIDGIVRYVRTSGTRPEQAVASISAALALNQAR